MNLELPKGCEPRCNSCAHRGWSAAESETQKKEWLKRALPRWSEQVEPIRGALAQERLEYRDRACLHAEWSSDERRWKFGLLVRGQGFDYDLVEIPRCPIHSKKVRHVLEMLSARLPGQETLPLRFVLIAGELVTLVLKTPIFPSALRALFSADGPINLEFLGVRGIFVNLNPAAGNRVTSSRGWELVAGQATAKDLLGLSYGPESFQQLIPRLYESSVQGAADFLDPGPRRAVVDLCSGVGRTLRLWTDKGASAVGVELSGESVKLCAESAPRAEMFRGRASDRVPQLQKWVDQQESQLLMYVNPPRLGLEPEVLDWISKKALPERIAYLSCSAGTLSRDLAVLEQAGYAVRRIIPYDFFPQTKHVEVLALLDLGLCNSTDPCRHLRTDG